VVVSNRTPRELYDSENNFDTFVSQYSSFFTSVYCFYIRIFTNLFPPVIQNEILPNQVRKMFGMGLFTWFLLTGMMMQVSFTGLIEYL